MKAPTVSDVVVVFLGFPVGAAAATRDTVTSPAHRREMAWQCGVPSNGKPGNMTGWWYTYPSEKYESQLG